MPYERGTLLICVSVNTKYFQSDPVIGGVYLVTSSYYETKKRGFDDNWVIMENLSSKEELDFDCADFAPACSLAKALYGVE